MARLVDVYPYRLRADKIQFLLLKRSENMQYAGQWRMVAGKVEEGEKAWQAGLRELKEETSLVPESYWTIPSVNHFYNKRNDQVELIPAFAAAVQPNAQIILNKEHQDFQWIEAAEIVPLVHWPEQIRLVELAESIISRDEIIDDWKIPF
ncbi:MAG: NUDIX pyrophosphatase [Balneolaceae bacterium]|nr:NUDIX pyrophosphatase [Balneolaceae bacterium]